MKTPNVANRIHSADFFKAGKALFTVSNPKGERYTFQIRRPKTKDILFASLVNGGESGRAYLGVYDPTANVVRSTWKSCVREDSVTFKVLAWALRAVAQDRIPEGYAVQHEGRCCRCGKALVDPDSINLGIGPDCRKKVMA